MRAKVFVRNAEAGELFEDFLVSAVAAILTIRLFLHVTGYPKVGGESLHVAHMLWGGLLMAVAVLLLFGFLGRSVKGLAAVVGGIGFGTFIDELGKFVTHDNDYFFQPTVALMYVVFILMYVAFHRVYRRPLSPQESVANALELAHEAVRGDLDPTERRRALALLEAGGEAGPLAGALRDVLRRSVTVPAPRPHLLDRVKGELREVYRRLVGRRWLAPLVVGFFIVHSIAMLVKALFTLPGALGVVASLSVALLLVPLVVRGRGAWEMGLGGRALVWGIVAGAVLLGLFAVRGWLPGLSFFEWGGLLFSVVPALLVVAGVMRMGRSRLAAYRLFEKALLVLIFVTQFVAFYRDQFLAVFGLFVNIVILATLRYMMHQEESLRAEGSGNAEAATGAA